MEKYIPCRYVPPIFSSSQLSAAIPVGNTPPVGLWTLPGQELRRSLQHHHHQGQKHTYRVTHHENQTS